MTCRLLPLAAILSLTLLGGCEKAKEANVDQTARSANEETTVEDVSPDGLAAPDNMALESESGGGNASDDPI